MQEQFFRRTWTEIDLDAFEHNYKVLRSRLNKNTKMMAVIKADAYGHGVDTVSSLLADLGVDAFGVSSISEALQLRSFGHTLPILILGYTPPELAGRLAAAGITQNVYDSRFAKMLSDEAVKAEVTVSCHIKLDVGMGRLGFNAADDDCVKQIIEVSKLPGLKITGIFTHFPSADFDGDESGEITRSQAALYKKRVDELENSGIKFKTRHCCNSSGALILNEYWLDMVREGISLYGLAPSAKLKGVIDLKPCMALKTVVSMVKTIPQGATVSYGRTFKAPHEMKLATVCIGYADGYPRALSDGGVMLVNGKRAPIVGRICMDQLMLDVTGIDGVNEGCEVTVFGSDAGVELSVDELAKICRTINYELVCIVGKRVPRVFIKNGKITAVTDYIK